MSHTTADFLTSVNRRCFAPTGQTTFETSDILDIGDEEMRSTILPEIISVREEYFVHYKDYSLVADQAAYAIPERAVGLIAREIQLIDDNGRVTNLSRIDIEDIDHTTLTDSKPRAFFIRNNMIVLCRIPSAANGTLRVHFFLRPGDLIESSAGATITAINTTTNVVTVGAIISTWATGDVFDLIKKSGGHEYQDFSLTSTLISGSDITFATLPDTLTVGDFVAPEAQSQVIQLPKVYQPCLAQATAAFMLDNMHIPGSEKAYMRLNKMLKAAKDLISPRVQGEIKTVKPMNWI